MWCFRTGVASGCTLSWAAGGVGLLGCFLAATATDQSLLLPTEQCRPACFFLLLFFFNVIFCFMKEAKLLGYLCWSAAPPVGPKTAGHH